MISLTATYNCKTIEEFLAVIEASKDNQQVQISASPARIPIKGEKGPYEKQWLEQSGNAFVRITKGVKAFMDENGLDLEGYCKYRLEGGNGESTPEETEGETIAIPEECEIDLENVV